MDITKFNVAFHIVDNERLCRNQSYYKQAISARERALYQLTVCFEFLSKSEKEIDTKFVPCKWYSEVPSLLLRCKM